jgi:hypothetical protein
VSNPVDEADRDRWTVEEALDALRVAVPVLLEELAGA